MPEQVNDLFANQNEPEKVNYVLTSKRYIIRILDIGLITPELVVCTDTDNIALIPEDQLTAITKIESYPVGPVLIELKKQEPTQRKVISVNEIKAIHFPTVDDRDDYLSRPFDNVPNELFTLKATPDFFKTENTENSDLVFPKLNKQKLGEKYRNIDMFAGMFWFYLANLASFKGIKADIANILGIELKELANTASQKVMIPKATGVDLDAEVSAIFTDYIMAVAKYPIEEGWVAKEILADLKATHIENEHSSLFKTWWDVSNEIANNERALIPLTDDKQIILRAMLLHLLNPEKEAIDRMANREHALGEKVQAIAHYLAIARQGFSAISAKQKNEKEGAYFLISSLMSAAINNTDLPIDNLMHKEISDTETELTWNHKFIKRVTIPKKVVSEEAEEANEVVSLQEVKDLMSKINKVSSTSIEDEFVYFTLDKKALKPITLPKHAAFSLKLDEQEIVCNALLLDLSIASHGKKLTGPKMRAMLEYQTEKGKYFSFNLIPDQCLQAAIRLPSSELNAELAEEILQQLIDVQTWFKS